VVDMAGCTYDYMLDFFHGEIALGTLMLAKRNAIGQMLGVRIRRSVDLSGARRGGSDLVRYG
jgi:hypothetical protein